MENELTEWKRETELEQLEKTVKSLSMTVETLQRENAGLEQRVALLEKAVSSALGPLTAESVEHTAPTAASPRSDQHVPHLPRCLGPVAGGGDGDNSVQTSPGALHEPSPKGTEVLQLLRAAQDGDLCTVEQLLQAGVAVDAASHDGETALLRAAKSGHWALVMRLLERGAAAGACNRRLESALEAAARSGHEEAVGELLRRGAAADPALMAHALKVAATAGVVRAFARASPDACRGMAAEEALRRAASAGREGALRALLAAGADPNALCRFGLTTLRFSGWRALHHAAWGGHAACVHALLAHGAHANARTRQGDAPLHLAARGGREACVHALLAHGADPSAQNERGQTPRDVALDHVRHALDHVGAVRDAAPTHAL